jgi:Plasmid encoded RepA protein
MYEEVPTHYGKNMASLKKSRLNKLITEYLAIEAENAKEAGMMLAYMARAMVMTTLPHSKPKSHLFQRTNGNFTLVMHGDPKLGLTYGSLPHLILAWMAREVKVRNSPILCLGRSFSAFVKTLILSNSGDARGDATCLCEQMIKLFSMHISCIYQNSKEGVCKAEQFSVSRSFELSWNRLKAENGKISHQSMIVLVNDFFEEIVFNRSVPVDFRRLQALCALLLPLCKGVRTMMHFKNSEQFDDFPKRTTFSGISRTTDNPFFQNLLENLR